MFQDYLSNPVQVKVGKVSSPTANVCQVLEKASESEKVCFNLAEGQEDIMFKVSQEY